MKTVRASHLYGGALSTVALAMLAQNRAAQAQRESDRAVALVGNPQHVLSRLPVAIAAARVRGASNVPVALKALEAVRAEAVSHGIPRFEFEARRATVEVESRRSLSAGAALGAALRKDAVARGFGLYAR